MKQSPIEVACPLCGASAGNRCFAKTPKATNIKDNTMRDVKFHGPRKQLARQSK